MCSTIAVIGAVAATAGCASDEKKTPPPAAVTPSAATTVAAAARPSTISLSPAGVTTKIDVPAHSTEEEYSQACHAADIWMKAHPGERQALVESYLGAVQQPGVVGPGTWNIAWAALSLARQAGVIVAAKAAANDECG
jgi:Putative lipoprotein LpqV